jgi:2',3'-cyclic-nucleotide 2'-phosphodiesterase (5'-nucleotidase family)
MKTLKQLIPILLITGIFFSGCATSTQYTVSEPTQIETAEWNLTLLHTNDMHAAFVPERATWRNDRAYVGGIAALQSHIDEQREASVASFLLDAGDFMTGNPICEIETDGIKGAGWIDMMSQLGYDASVIGNHEFDIGRENAKALEQRANFPLMALDVYNEEGELEFPDQPVVIERGGVKIGIIGVSCSGLIDVVADIRIKGISLVDQAPLIREWATKLDSKTDLLVVLSHNGLDGDRELAENLEGSGIDLIVGGHSHTRLYEPVKIGDIIIVQAGAKTQNLGRLDMVVGDDRIVYYKEQLIQVLSDGRTGRPEMEKLVAYYSEAVESEYGKVIGQLTGDWKRSRKRESNVGNWLTDQLRLAANADIGLLNSGTIRKNMMAGPITLMDIVAMLPFSNTLEMFEADANMVRKIVQENAQAAVDGRHGILQISGLAYQFAIVDEKAVIKSITILGEPLINDKIYTVACPDYVVSKSEVYFGSDSPSSKYTGFEITEVIIDAIKAAGTINPSRDGRMSIE